MVEFGDIAKDKVTGFTGMAVARHSYITGCDRLTLQPPVDKDGKIPESYTFDEPMLELVTAKHLELPVFEEPGGPERWTDKRWTVELKYIMLHLHEPIERFVPILFPDIIVHSLMAEAMRHYADKGFDTAQIRSAGIFNTYTEKAYGSSASLLLSSHEDDSRIIANYEYEHGIVV
jgi:hypothetical protein